MATKPRMPPAGMMSGNPTQQGQGGQAEAMTTGPGPSPMPAPMQGQEQGQEFFTEDDMKEHGMRCAIMAKWDTVLRQVYWENAGDPKRQVVASTIYEIMVHFGFENPPEETQQQETA